MRFVMIGQPEGAFAALQTDLAAAGFSRADNLPADLLIALPQDADAAIVGIENFADVVVAGQEALVVNILHGCAQDDWPGARAASLIWAFTRHAALAWAPRRIRVNAIGLGVSPKLLSEPSEASGQPAGPSPAVPATPEDIAATVRAMWNFPSMTGQLIRLGAP